MCELGQSHASTRGVCRRHKRALERSTTATGGCGRAPQLLLQGTGVSSSSTATQMRAQA